MTEKEEPAEGAMARRRLLRRAGGVAAGVAGATVVGGIVAPSPASAAAGGNLVLGQPNNADTAVTGLTANSPASGTLALSNTGLQTIHPIVNGNPANVDVIGPQLRLVPPAASNPQELADGEVGSIGVLSDGSYWVVATQNFSDQVYTGFVANMLVPIVPTRVLDTRDPNQRVNIIDANPPLDAQGRLLGGHFLNIDLGGLVFAGQAVHGNLTVTDPLGGGFASLLPGGGPTTVPTTSNVNFDRGQTIPNFAVCAIGSALGRTDVVTIFAISTTHVLLDVAAFTVNYKWQVFNGVQLASSGLTAKAAGAGVSREQLVREGKPNWAKH